MARITPSINGVIFRDMALKGPAFDRVQLKNNANNGKHTSNCFYPDQPIKLSEIQQIWQNYENYKAVNKVLTQVHWLGVIEVSRNANLMKLALEKWF